MEYIRNGIKQPTRRQMSLSIRLVAFMLLLFQLPAAGQNCELNFPGISNLTFSGACGGSASGLELGKDINMSDGDTFTFDRPVINITDLHIDAEGNAKIIIPAGVTVNLNGDVRIHFKNGQCSSANPCVFEFIVNGTANFSDKLDNDISTVVWSGTGTVTVGDRFRNSRDGCMACGVGGCPNIQVDEADCEDDGEGCAGGDFCAQINSCGSDVTLPVITGCPSDQTLALGALGCTRFVTWTAPTAIDNCSLASFATSHNPGTFFPKGVTTVTYNARDTKGNIATCSFKITVVDNIDPGIIGCPSNITVNANASCQAVVNWTPPVFIDNCTGTTMTATKAPGTIFNKGITTVVYTATDAAGNTSTCSFNVTVIDNVAPVMTGCPTNMTVNANASCQAVVSWTAPAFTDNCTGGNITSTKTPGSTFNKGITTVVYTATDAAGNTATCSFNVTVVDNTAPVIVGCPANITVNANASCRAVVTWTAPTVADNCTGGTLVTSKAPGSTFNKGTTVVVYTATDAAGNMTTCSFNVTVIDNTPPVIAGCPSNITVNANGSCQATATWTAPTFTDNCTGATLSTTKTPGSIFSKGTTTVIYTATDAAGNMATCSFNVTVVDNTRPILTGCPSNITVNANASCEAVVSWTAPSFADNCSVGTLSATKAPGSIFNKGVTTVVYTATDPAGNTATCSFNVNVIDNTPPVLSGSPEVVATAGTSCSVKVNFSPPSVEECGVITLTSSHAPGAEFPVGQTEVTYTATNSSGLSSTFKLKVKVEDKSMPVFQQCPGDIVVTTSNNCMAAVNWSLPVVTDNCGMVAVTSSHNPNDNFRAGKTKVTYTATDSHGNVSTCSFNVIVNSAPIFMNCPGDIILKGNEMNMAAADWIPLTASSPCGDVTVTGSHIPGDFFSVGTTVVTYEATDAFGYSSQCAFNVNVSPTEIEIDIAKVVTPDGNGTNDQWVLKNIEKFRDNKVTIVDRWGGLIFTGTNYNNLNIVWEGKNRNGEPVPTGTYFYTIAIQFGSAKFERSGFIELIR